MAPPKNEICRILLYAQLVFECSEQSQKPVKVYPKRFEYMCKKSEKNDQDLLHIQDVPSRRSLDGMILDTVTHLPALDSSK